LSPVLDVIFSHQHHRTDGLSLLENFVWVSEGLDWNLV